MASAVSSASFKERASTPVDVPEPEESVVTIPVTVSLAWRDLTPMMMQHLGEAKDVDAIVAVLAEHLALKDHKTNARHSIELDFYVANLTFAQECALTAEQSSALFTIFKTVYRASFLENTKLPLNDSYNEFKTMLLQHAAASTAPDAAKLFAIAEIKKITDYAIRTLYRHYKMYQYVYTHEQESVTRTEKLFTETLITPRPLSSGMTQADWTAEQQRRAAEQQALALAQARAKEIEENVQKALSTTGAPLLAELSKDMTQEEVKELLSTALAERLAVLRQTVAQQLEQHTASLHTRVAKLEENAQSIKSSEPEMRKSQTGALRAKTPDRSSSPKIA